MWRVPHHACNLTDRFGAAIDHAVLSEFPAPTNQRRLS